MARNSQHPANQSGNLKGRSRSWPTLADGTGLADNTSFATPEGWTSLEDMAAGQQVFDQLGRVCTVTGVHRQGVVPVHQVRFDDGSTLLTGGRQEWITISDRQRSLIREGTRWLARWAEPALFGITALDIGRSLSHDAGGCPKANHSIPLGKALELPERDDLPIDPYLLGLWLGDGSSSQPIIHCHWADEPHYFMRASLAGENWFVLRKKGNVLSCGLAHGGATPFVSRLRTLEVFRNKHVPARYLRASREQRIQLLHGLMDSDGHIDDRGQAEYTSISEKLAEGVLELARTLGQKATIHKGKATLNGRVVSDKFRIFFAPTIRAMWLPRKAARLDHALRYRERAAFPRPAQRYIRAVTPMGCWSTTRITVDSPSQMVLAGTSMIPTLMPSPNCPGPGRG